MIVNVLLFSFFSSSCKQVDFLNNFFNFLVLSCRPALLRSIFISFFLFLFCHVFMCKVDLVRGILYYKVMVHCKVGTSKTNLPPKNIYPSRHCRAIIG